jgi:hypothetical protein
MSTSGLMPHALSASKTATQLQRTITFFCNLSTSELAIYIPPPPPADTSFDNKYDDSVLRYGNTASM